MSSKRIAGTCYFKVNGSQLETTVEGEVDISLLTVKRETLKPGFYKETLQNPKMTGTFLFTKDFPLELLEEADDLTITVELANGKVATLQEAYTDLEGRRVRAIRYRADFTYRERDGRLVVEDVKSKPTRTREYLIKRKLMKERRGIDITEV